MRAIVPLLNSRKSASTPSEKITPPIGMNVFVLSRIMPDVTTWQIFRGVLPYIGADVVRIALLLAFPAIVLWLPNLLFD